MIFFLRNHVVPKAYIAQLLAKGKTQDCQSSYGSLYR